MKKATKTTKQVNVRVHRVWAVVALVGLFACGFMIGVDWRDNAPKKQLFTDAQCEKLISRIDAHIYNAEWDKLENARDIFAKNCAGYVVPVAPVVTEEVVEEKRDLTTCQRIEELLLGRLEPEDSNSLDDHVYNVDIYTKLVSHGCPENAQRWHKMFLREMEIGNALYPDAFEERLRGLGVMADSGFLREPACAEIERAMKEQIRDCERVGGYDAKVECYLDNAEVYSSMVQNGCPGNMMANKEMALRQIEIATALKDEAELNAEEVESVIDTYKKLQMQEQAQMVLNKIQMLTNPAIDFILQMDRIINQ